MRFERLWILVSGLPMVRRAVAAMLGVARILAIKLEPSTTHPFVQVVRVPATLSVQLELRRKHRRGSQG